MATKNRILYFIECNDYAIKIGFTEDLNKRMKQLQTGNPYSLKILHIIENINPELERFIHAFFREFHITQEWYKHKEVFSTIEVLKTKNYSMLGIIKMINPMLYQAYKYKQETGKNPWWYSKIKSIAEQEDINLDNETPDLYISRMLEKWNKEHVSAF